MSAPYEKPINWRTSPVREARSWETIVDKKKLEEAHSRLAKAFDYFHRKSKMIGKSPNNEMVISLADYNFGTDELIEALKLIEEMEGVNTESNIKP